MSTSNGHIFFTAASVVALDDFPAWPESSDEQESWMWLYAVYEWHAFDRQNRPHVLDPDSLLDVFGCVGREDLDNWTIVSKQLGRTTWSAAPLRRVETIHASRNYHTGEYEAAVDKFRGGKVVIAMGDATEWEAVFFGLLRGSWIVKGLSMKNLPIGSDFVVKMRSMKTQWSCRGKWDQVALSSLDFSMCALVLHLLTSFPDVRSISPRTLHFLGEYYRPTQLGTLDDVLLGVLTSIGVREIGPATASALTDEGTLRFLFADCTEADEQRRYMELSNVDSLSNQFLVKLVKACRECKSEHPFELFIKFKHLLHFDLDQFAGQVHETDLRGTEIIGTQLWDFHFDEPAGLKVKMRSRFNGRATITLGPQGPAGSLHVVRHCEADRKFYRPGYGRQAVFIS